MNTQKFQRLGWFVAASLAALLVLSGFQASETKTGVVDITSVIERSKFGMNGQTEFAALKAARESLLDYANNNRIMTPEQSLRLKELSLKASPSAAEKAELERIKSDIQASETKNKELLLKTTLTPEEKVLVEEYAKRASAMDLTGQRWFAEFQNDLQTWADKRKIESLNKARTAVQEVGKAQGFSVVFEVGVAPYGANDLTDAALKAMDAKYPN